VIEAEARTVAKTLRLALIGVTADVDGSGTWGVRTWAPSREAPGLIIDVNDLPRSWQMELNRSTTCATSG
jgi:hypothetical protein